MPPAFKNPARLAFQLSQSLATLTLSARGQQIAKPLHLNEVNFAIQERPPRELARLRRAQAPGGQILQHRFHDGTTAMQMELAQILTGKAMRGHKGEH